MNLVWTSTTDFSHVVETIVHSFIVMWHIALVMSDKMSPSFGLSLQTHIFPDRKH